MLARLTACPRCSGATHGCKACGSTGLLSEERKKVLSTEGWRTSRTKPDERASFALFRHLMSDDHIVPERRRPLMKLKLLLAALAAAGLVVSSGVAAPPAGKGKPDTTGPNCKPKVTVVLKGTLTGAPLSVDVKSSNRWGRAYVAGTASTSIAVDANTKVRRQGKKLITDLVVGDRVLVKARVCKEDLEDSAMPALTASKVVAHPAKAESEEDDD
jgi:hypothetical protein